MDNHCSFTRPSPTLCLRARWNCSLLICWHYRERTNSRLRSTVSQVQASTLLRELWLAPRFRAALLGSCCRMSAGRTGVQTMGWISNLRFSPKGDEIAFMDHPVRWDNAGFVAATDLNGRRRTLTQKWAIEDGLAWSPKGDEIWC